MSPAGSIALHVHEAPQAHSTQPEHLLYKPQPAPKAMDLPTPDVEGYKAGNTMACHEQMVSLIAANTPAEEGTSTLVRAFAFEVAASVGAEYCHHDTAPEPLPSMALATAKKAAAEHPGLCGVYHAHVIAAVRTEDVTSRSGSTAANKFRNQVSIASGRGAGVAAVVWCCCWSTKALVVVG